MYATHASAGLRPRGEAPDHARHLRAERRLLRRVLPEGAAGAHADPAATTTSAFERVDVVAMPTSPTRGLQDRRAGRRSAADVPRSTSSPSARTSRAFRRSACHAASPPIGCPSACSSPDGGSTRRRCSGSRTRTSETPNGAKGESQSRMSDPDWASWPDEKLLGMRMCDLGLAIEGTELEQRIAPAQRRARRRAASRSGPTTGSRTNGSRPTACPASRSRSTWRTRAWRSSSSRRCSRSKGAIPSRA